MSRAARQAPIELDAEEFRRLGHGVVDRLADFLQSLEGRRVAPGESLEEVRAALAGDGLPEAGSRPEDVLDEAARLLFDHSTLNGHPRFFGYITSSAAPIGALGDLLAAGVNPNVGGWPLAPLAREGYAQMISDDIALARTLHRLADPDPGLEAWTTSLSITTFRYVPASLQPGLPDTED